MSDTDDAVVGDALAALAVAQRELDGAGRGDLAQELASVARSIRDQTDADAPDASGPVVERDAADVFDDSIADTLQSEQVVALTELCGGSRAQAVDWWMIRRHGARPSSDAHERRVAQWADRTGNSTDAIRRSVSRAEESIVENMTADAYRVLGDLAGIWGLPIPESVVDAAMGNDE